jgi:hypothetical protein
MQVTELLGPRPEAVPIAADGGGFFAHHERANLIWIVQRQVIDRLLTVRIRLAPW